jgi:hypothetical protein
VVVLLLPHLHRWWCCEDNGLAMVPRFCLQWRERGSMTATAQRHFYVLECQDVRIATVEG